jgi:hypothetical protein
MKAKAYVAEHEAKQTEKQILADVINFWKSNSTDLPLMSK